MEFVFVFKGYWEWYLENWDKCSTIPLGVEFIRRCSKFYDICLNLKFLGSLK